MFEVALHRKRIPKSIQSTFFSTPLRLKLKKIQGLLRNVHRNSRTFQEKMEFKDFSRTPPKIQGLFKTVRTLLKGQSHQDLVLLQNPMKVLLLIGNPLIVT